MKNGVDYSARLQRIPGDQHLCGGDQSNVTVPNDGLPIALVVKKGLCSYAQKAQYASRNIHPPGLVKIIIIDGGIQSTYEEDEDTNYDYDYDEVREIIVPSNIPKQLSQRRLPDERTVALRRNHDDGIAVALLHVSYQTGYELLDIILNEEMDVKNSGGILVKLNGISPPPNRATVVIWVILCLLVSCIICCCVSNAFSELAEEEEPEPEPYRRPRRPRLNAEQVTKTFPIGVFDSRQLIYETTTSDDAEIGGACDNFPQPEAHSLDACTICLDEFVVGDKLRCLPCNHVFHAECIAKWLIERSATCPLCKIDLYEEETEDDDNNEEEIEIHHQNDEQLPHQQGLASSWDSVPPETLISTSTGTSEDGLDRSWWSRIFSLSLFTSPEYQRQIDTGTRANETLSEPLLHTEEHSNNNVPPSVPAQSNSNHQHTALSNATTSSSNEETLDGGS